MRKLTLAVISTLFITCGFFHLLMTFAYLVPENLLGQKLAALSHVYIGSRFEQNWHLFSPNPGIADTSIWIKCVSQDGKFSDWSDPLANLLEQHHKSRITGVGKLLYVYDNIPRVIKNEYRSTAITVRKWCSNDPKVHQAALDILKKQYSKSLAIPEKDPKLCSKDAQRAIVDKLVKMSRNSAVARQFASQYCRDATENSLAFQIRVVETMPKKFSERFSDKKYGLIEVIDFEPELLIASAP